MTGTDRLQAGVLLPESILSTDAFAVLAAFVAVNTLVYVALSVAKVLPKVYVSDLDRLRGGNPRRRRAETRSIYPDVIPDDLRQPPEPRPRGA